ncbi:hypothetical protein [Marinibacterium sp. SX1]|uniref:hypothetical protein n=1 Tax=Marinibacterium sp. SX1 TaxID=3388424 RepID=UPI003D1667BC
MRPLLTAAVASLALPLAMAGAALAQQSLLSAYDANADGVLDRTEFQAAQVDTFNGLDGNGDGLLTRAEIDARGGKSGNIMSRDGNGDGALTQTEFLSQAPGFTRADRNRDGVLGGQELARLEQFMARARG